MRRSRVRKDAVLEADIHDRVNYAVEASQLRIEPEKKLCIFTIEIATEICPVMEYFEIFLGAHGAVPQGPPRRWGFNLN